MAFEADAYRSFGHLHCPMCFCMREFVSDDPNCHDPAEAECEICGYQFGHAVDEATGARKPVLKPAVVEDARQRRLHEFHTSLISSGVRREALTGVRRPSTDSR